MAYTEKNMTEYEEACDRAADAKQRRQEKRERKRRRLGQRQTTRSIFGQDSSSEDDIPIIKRRRPGHHELSTPESDSLFVRCNEKLPIQPEKLTVPSALTRPPLVPRKLPLEQSSSDSESSTSEGSIAIRKKRNQATTKSSQRRDSHGLGSSILQPKSSEHTTHASSNSVVNPRSSNAPTTSTAQMPGAPPAASNQHTSKRRNSTDRAASRHTTATSLATGSRAAAATASAATASAAAKESSNPNTAIRTPSKSSLQAAKKLTSCTQAPAPIKFVDQPAVQRKEWHSDKQFSTLKYRHNAAKRASAEKPPDVGSLSFVNGPPTGLSTATPPTRADNLYGRRDTTELRARDEDAGGETLQNDISRRSSGTAVEPLAEWEADKRGLS